MAEGGRPREPARLGQARRVAVEGDRRPAEVERAPALTKDDFDEIRVVRVLAHRAVAHVAPVLVGAFAGLEDLPALLHLSVGEEAGQKPPDSLR